MPFADHIRGLFPTLEPAARLREFMRDKAAASGIANLYVLDGTLAAIPLPTDTTDALGGERSELTGDLGVLPQSQRRLAVARLSCRRGLIPQEGEPSMLQGLSWSSQAVALG